MRERENTTGLSNMVAPEKRRKISKPGQLNIVGDEDEESVHTTVQMVQNMASSSSSSSSSTLDSNTSTKVTSNGALDMTSEDTGNVTDDEHRNNGEGSKAIEMTSEIENEHNTIDTTFEANTSTEMTSNGTLDVTILDDRTVILDDDVSTIHDDDEERQRKVTEDMLVNPVNFFEQELQTVTSTNFLSTKELKMIGLPKQFSRDVNVLEQQLKTILELIHKIRPINDRNVIMPGLKNFYGNMQNRTDKKVRNICYFNAVVNVVSACDSIVSNALSYLKKKNPSWCANVDLLEESRKVGNTSTKALVVGRSQSSFAENFCNLLLAMRSKDLHEIMIDTYKYKDKRLRIDSTKVMTTFYDETNTDDEDKGKNIYSN